MYNIETFVYRAIFIFINMSFMWWHNKQNNNPHGETIFTLDIYH